MSLLLLLYGTGEEGGSPSPPAPALTEEEIAGLAGFLPTPKVKRKRKPNDVAYNYRLRLLRDDEELALLLSLMDE